MSRRLERLGLWLGATVGGAGLIYAAVTAPSNTAPALLGVLWVLGAAMLAVGIIGFGNETVAFVNRVLPDEQTPAPPYRRTPDAPPKPEARPSAEAERQFVQVTPAYLLGLFDTHTTRDVSRLTADFIGKWMRVSGDVRDVIELGDELFVQIFDAEQRLIGLRFRGERVEQASTLRRGDHIEAIGRIKDVDQMHVSLDPAELHPPDNQPSKAAIS